jgi:hypothetical protein
MHADRPTRRKRAAIDNKAACSNCRQCARRKPRGSSAGGELPARRPCNSHLEQLLEAETGTQLSLTGGSDRGRPAVPLNGQQHGTYARTKKDEERGTLTQSSGRPDHRPGLSNRSMRAVGVFKSALEVSSRKGGQAVWLCVCSNGRGIASPVATAWPVPTSTHNALRWPTSAECGPRPPRRAVPPRHEPDVEDDVVPTSLRSCGCSRWELSWNRMGGAHAGRAPARPPFRRCCTRA